MVGVMTILMCQQDWTNRAPDSRSEVILGVSVGCFWMRVTRNQWTKQSRVPSLMPVGLTQSVEEPDSTTSTKTQNSVPDCAELGQQFPLTLRLGLKHQLFSASPACGRQPP